MLINTRSRVKPIGSQSPEISVCSRTTSGLAPCLRQGAFFSFVKPSANMSYVDHGDAAANRAGDSLCMPRDCPGTDRKDSASECHRPLAAGRLRTVNEQLLKVTPS